MNEIAQGESVNWEDDRNGDLRSISIWEGTGRKDVSEWHKDCK